MNRRTPLVYGLLLLTWATILIWQGAEHRRVRRTAQAALINHAKDVSTTLGLVMNSQRRFGVISQDRMESALGALIKPGELEAIALLNHAGDVVASAGSTINYELKGLAPRGEHWDHARVTLVNLVDLGTNVTAGPGDVARPTLVLKRDDMPGPFDTNRPGPPGGPPPSAGPASAAGGPPFPPPEWRDPTNPPPPGVSAAGTEPGSPWTRNRGRRPPFGRPFWMDEQEYRAALEKQGVHSSVVVLSTGPALAVITQDFWMRGFVGLLATVTVAGLALAWRTLLQSADLEVRLARAAELNTRLRDMNQAATGLAQETRQPLSVIRDLAQEMAQQKGVATESRTQLLGIVNETQRVSAQLNEFIHFSRPREVRRAPVALSPVVAEIVGTLEPELKSKSIRFESAGELPTVEADEALLRQAVFNLLVNAIKAMDHEGLIAIRAQPDAGGLWAIEIRDDGPEVPAEHRLDIFRPYFTSNQRGRGLGLAVVHQIVQAHGWEITCLENSPRGAIMRVSHVRASSPG